MWKPGFKKKAGKSVQIVANFMYKAENVVVREVGIRIWKIVQTSGKSCLYSFHLRGAQLKKKQLTGTDCLQYT